MDMLNSARERQSEGPTNKKNNKTKINYTRKPFDPKPLKLLENREGKRQRDTERKNINSRLSSLNIQ